MSRPGRLPNNRGFTLIEVVIASAIMAVIALSLFTALRIGFQARDKALSSVGPARAAEIAMDMVRRDLEAALPPRGTLAKEFFGQDGPETPGTSAVRFYAIGRAPDTATNGSASGMFSSARPAGAQQQDPTSAGGGIEQKITDNFSIGVLYRYTRFKTDGYTVRAGQGTPPSATNPFVITPAGYTDIQRTNDTFENQSVRATASFRF